MRRLLLWAWERTFGPEIRQVEADANAYRAATAGRELDSKTVIVLLTVAAALTVQNFTSHPSDLVPVTGFVARQVGGADAELAVKEWLAERSATQLGRLTWWACSAYATYVLIPLLVIVLVLKERPTDYGLKVRGWYHGWKIYLAFVAVMVPLVWVFSAEARFQASYPFYKVRTADEIGPELLRWEILYALQFVALEFFFRGFIVHGTKHQFGAYSTFVMTVPYCMIHFGKPMPECVASIVAGVALGLMSLATRSVWLGAALHVSVAWGMDICALSRRGLMGW
jgi:membrane protease YdiL (CAAX protease family)